ncbi:substrate-binding domain-containing protein [Clostridium thermobutyricum]|uniref:substrate-binding domain-containing protein n=1 Tax=Clostridium thermobutyricum TaxID=29372 RepID=UPI0029426D83|nr:substrate-binding domain-containing protein [Clostridium thermobutyricum]
MKKRKKRILVFTFSLAVISLIIFINEAVLLKEKDEVFNISVITKGGKINSFSRLKGGIDGAKKEMGVNINFINLEGKYNKEEQIKVLREELNKDVDAILIQPIEYNYIKEEIDKSKKKTPIVVLETKVEDSKVINIPYDNYKIGYKLADEIMSRGHFKKNILVLIEDDVDYIQKRKEGFIESIKLTNNMVQFLKVKRKEEIERIFKENKGDIIVTFDMELLEEIAKIKEGLFKESKIEVYGVGTNDYIISALEKGIINGFSVQSEFNMGYLGVKAAVDLIKKNSFEDVVIDSRMINCENMYYDYNQKILFPFLN